ncbi:MAG: reverse transcriptase domain-containing protein, partial [Candidatus Brocadiia bacterium]
EERCLRFSIDAGSGLQPIFEADLHPQQHGYRPGHSAKQAVQQVHRLVSRGHTDVVDADLSGYFDSIPHRELMKSVSRRISDGAVLELIEMWLEMPVEETDDDGNTRRSTRARDERRGTPQGACSTSNVCGLPMVFRIGNRPMHCVKALWAVHGRARTACFFDSWAGG